MKTIADPANILTRELAAIRVKFQVPAEFPSAVLTAAEAVAAKPLDEIAPDHVDWTDRHFVTLDPASSTDLDQAFAIEADGDAFLLHYAIADVAAFVKPGDPLDKEAWARGQTIYLPDGKASLYPPVLSQGSASLLPDGPRPAAIFTVRVAKDGSVQLKAATRAIIQSRAKLAYSTVTDADLPVGFAELTARLIAAETARGGARVDPPEQEVSEDADGRLTLHFRDRDPSEDQNAALSLACNIAVAQLLAQHGTGLFRVMDEPNAGAVAKLRQAAKGLEIPWANDEDLKDVERRLSAQDPRHAAFMLAIRRAGNGASYRTHDPESAPWHSAVAAPYAHVTAPLRRLADRYVIDAAMAVANGQPVPEHATEAFSRLPKIMARSGQRVGQIDRAVIDMAEAAMLLGKEGESFCAIVTENGERGTSIQLCDLPITAKVDERSLAPGTRITTRLTLADPAERKIAFEVVA